ncbi:4974_t:CDS:2 [Gigaspora margarita]|uniref:4974_t:CDS:1 n=1 Tax=Gigaspora margarita TaxID=4874 RepID=A0ABM8W1K1_GIGMA|nr:4974_t:CDS:2 [Gigaspora margarita]
MSTRKPPHCDIEYDEALAIQICHGLRCILKEFQSAYALSVELQICLKDNLK